MAVRFRVALSDLEALSRKLRLWARAESWFFSNDAYFVDCTVHLDPMSNLMSLAEVLRPLGVRFMTPA